MAEACRKTPLTGAYCLSDIPPECRCPEMGFTLHTEDFGLKRLRDWFARDDIRLPEVCRAAAETLDFHTVNGFLNGFIDMVCQDPDGNICVIDYKSNHLGADASAYTQQAMDEAVAHHHYYASGADLRRCRRTLLQTARTTARRRFRPLPVFARIGWQRRRRLALGHRCRRFGTDKITSRPLRRQPQENPMNIKHLITAALIASAAFAAQAAPQKP